MAYLFPIHYEQDMRYDSRSNLHVSLLRLSAHNDIIS